MGEKPTSRYSPIGGHTRQRQVLRRALAAGLPLLVIGVLVHRFTASRCGSIDWASPTVDEHWWRSVPRVALGGAAQSSRAFDAAFSAYAQRPVVLVGLMEEWPALARWSPAWFRERFGARVVEVYYWGRTGLDWEAGTRIEPMSLGKFVDEAMLREGEMPGYVQESAFLEDEDDNDDDADDDGGGGSDDDDDDGSGGSDDGDGDAWSEREADAPAVRSAAVRAARTRADALMPASKSRVWADVLWFPRLPLPAAQLSSLETAFWMGGAGVGTGVHYDASPAFLHQVYGVKRVALWPPSARAHLYPSDKFNYLAELSKVDARPWLQADPAADGGVDARARGAARFPRFAALPNVTIDLQPGETLAVPPGWWHATLTLSPSISVAVRAQSACQRRADWFDDVLLALHGWGLYKRGWCVCHPHEPVG